MAESVHSGHRSRMRRRFLETGFTGFQPHEVLEMILFYCIPRRDTNEIAHKLRTDLGARCGGNAKMIQGSVAAQQLNIRALF